VTEYCILDIINYKKLMLKFIFFLTSILITFKFAYAENVLIFEFTEKELSRTRGKKGKRS
jgi:hypothetical protein